MKTIPIVAVTLSLLTGCANLTDPARRTELEDKSPYWFDYDASRRGAIMVPKESKLKICSEPSPDVALNLVTKLEATVKKDAVGQVGGDAEFNSSVVKLAERTQMVMFLRETLYRLCEQSLNHEFSSTELIGAYEEAIRIAGSLVETDRENAKTQKAKAEAAKSLIDKGASVDEVRKLLAP